MTVEDGGGTANRRVREGTDPGMRCAGVTTRRFELG